MSEKISSLPIDHRLPRKFATLIHDENPIHIDDRYAREHGFKGAILQGMATFCLVVREVISDGDPTTLRSISVRFEAPVYPGDRIVLNMKREDKGILLSLRDQQGQLLLAGRATLR